MYRCLILFSFAAACVPIATAATVPLVSQTNAAVRIVAANLTSGSNQAYEAPGIRILQGLKPDIIAIQEFNYSGSIRAFVDLTFGTNFFFFRESGYSIPNGIISRYPILASGSWEDIDPGVNDRGFAWAQLDLPGTNDLYVVSVHLKASSSTSDRNRRFYQATNLVHLINQNLPPNAWIVVAGDFNLYDASEPAYTHLLSRFADHPVPKDQAGDPDTNAGRSERYDYVFTSFNFTNRLTSTVYGNRTFTAGLVFDSRVYTPLSDMTPAQAGDSGAVGMQHMAVVRTCQIPFTLTNYVHPPELAFASRNVLQWQPEPALTFRVQTTTNLALPVWRDVATVPGSLARFTNTYSGPMIFYRVVSP